MKFGAPVWPFKWDTPYEAAIRRINELGFRAVELIAWNQRQLDDYYTPDTIAKLRTVLDEHGMELSQFVVPTNDLAHSDPGLRRSAVETFKRGVQVGVELGTSVVNSVTHLPFGIPQPQITDRPHLQTFTVNLPGDLDWERNWHDYLDALRECAEFAQAQGVRYSLEAHPFRYGANTEGLLRILEAVNCPALAVNFDPSHLFPVGDIPHVSLYRLGKFVVHCHFSDNDGETNVHWRPGTGKINWTQVMQALKDIDYDGVVSLEFEDIPGVSRGPNDATRTYPPNEQATEAFAGEYRIALDYLTSLAIQAGLTVE